MARKREGIQFFPLLIGVILFLIIIAIVHAIFMHEFPIVLYILYPVLVIGLGLTIYFSIKNKDFRDKVFSGLNTFGVFLTKLGLDFVEGEEASRAKKKERIPINGRLKTKVFERADNRCQHCGHKGSLDIHHIDGNPANNKMSNLIVLCPNDHRQAPTIPKQVLKNEAKKPYRLNTTVINKYYKH